MWPHLIAAGVIVGVAVALLVRHARVWQRARTANLSAGELQFSFAQYRRRMQTSTMLAVVGGMIGGGPWVVAPLAVLLYWLGVIVLVVWIVLLAGADMLATRMHFAQLETEQHLRQIKLHAALEAERQKRGKGRAR